MTYARKVSDTKYEGLSLSINSRDIHIDNLFGGGRMGNIRAMDVNEDANTGVLTYAPATFGAKDYGTTLEIHDGWIERVFGGNDVSGRVYNGVHINLTGGLLHYVYGAGNGDYVYKYDRSATPVSRITEQYDETYGGRYFILPPVEGLGTSDEDAVHAINIKRPNIDKIDIDVNSDDVDTPVVVKESLFCGGSSSTVITEDLKAGDVNLNIGSNVILNRVFLGSDGERLVDSHMIDNIERVNDISMSSPTTNGEHLLDRYMEAVDMMMSTSDFKFNETTKNTFIGTFCLGCNSGSMETDQTIAVDFPENITIYNRIVGGCFNASFTYKGTYHEGGMLTPLGKDSDNRQLTDKVKMTVRCAFDPKEIKFDDNGKPSLVKDHATLYPEGDCSIFGGCFSSGTTVGNISIDLYSDMLAKVISNDDGENDMQMLKNSIDNSRAAFTFTGCGYGQGSKVIGDVRLRMMPVKNGRPSAGTIFGGSHNGEHIGNSTIEIRDGLVFNNIYGASRSSRMYGSTQTIIGYPDYYVCNTTGEYTLRRGDDMIHPYDNTPVLDNKVRYRQGEIVAPNVYDAIVKHDATKDAAFDLVENDKPNNAAIYDAGISWDDVNISVGYNDEMNKLDGAYYGGGGVYGGGQAMTDAVTSFSAINTLCRFENTSGNNFPVVYVDKTPDEAASVALIGYGGNSSIIVGDDPDATATEHVSIGTGHFVRTAVTKNKVSTYTPKRDASGNIVTNDGEVVMIHQGEGEPVDDYDYYKMETDGGVYGCGRQTYVEGFRAIDIYNYGYAEHTPQFPKLINTFQLASLLSLNDCCLQLQGARDYTGAAVDATIYSIDRIDELRLNSSLTGNLVPSVNDPVQEGNTLLDKKRARNYMAFYNNVHYIGGIYTNTAFDSAYRDRDGVLVTGESYRTNKSNKMTVALQDIKQRNVGTAPNMIGINNGFVLKVQNVKRTALKSNGLYEEELYYAPIEGVCEVKLLTMTKGEGGGYIYARDNHDMTGGVKKDLQVGGNFVFPASIQTGAGASSEVNYIVDNCYPADETAHYWFVEGNKYVFNTTLTAYTSNTALSRFYIDSKSNLIVLSGVDKNSKIIVESITWESQTDTPDGYQSALRNNDKYKLYLTVDNNTTNEYVPGNVPTGAYAAWVTNQDLAYVYNNADDAVNSADNGHFGNHATENDNTPILSIRLEDMDAANIAPSFYRSSLCVPENIVIKLKAILDETHADGLVNEYTINLAVKYLQGPYISGNVDVQNKALPGEYIYVDADDVQVDMDQESMWITGAKWYLYHDNGTTWVQEDVSSLNMSGNPSILALPALYSQNGWKVNYEVEINGEQTFSVYGDDKSKMPEINVSNYHRMKDVATYELKPEAGARVYIEDNADMAAFADFVNASDDGAAGIDFCLLGNVRCNTSISAFAGNLHGNGYAVTVNTTGAMIATNNGNIYNTGFVSASADVIGTNSGTVTNCYCYTQGSARLIASGTAGQHCASGAYYKYGDIAYGLNSYYQGTEQSDAQYVKDYYGDGVWRYAYTTTNGGLRLPQYNGVPNYRDQYGTRQTMQVADDPVDVGNHNGLYFGQKLSATGADTHPVHITAANRIYRAAGYYGSANDSLFYFNRAAEVYKPTITAIDFTNSAVCDLPDGDVAGIDSWSINSNADVDSYGQVTKNLLVYTPAACGSLFDAMHYTAATNLGGSETDENDIIGHHIVQQSDGSFAPYRQLFHLVDMQDFNAPKAFTLSGADARAWYIRKPAAYSSGNNAWESICLPFAVNSVYADDRGDIASTSRGYISHFHGESISGHDYWLRGFVSASTTGADPQFNFARVGAASSGLFEQGEIVAKYTYLNRWFETTYNNPMLEIEYFRDHFKNQQLDYDSYRYLTSNVPYIVAYPGMHYYEYDLSGEFHNSIYPSKEPAGEQTIWYVYQPVPDTGNDYSRSIASGGAVGALTIGVTDASARATTVGSYTHAGTFSRIESNASIYTISDDDVTGLPGKVFVTGADVLPFRTYVNVAASPSPAPRFVIGEYRDGGEEQPSDGDLSQPSVLNIYLSDNALVIESDADIDFPLYEISGRLIRVLTVRKGVNRYTGIAPGWYVVDTYKFRMQ